MKDIKTAAQLVTEFKRDYWGDDEGKIPSAKELVDNHGVRIRRNKHTKEFGDNVWELATTFFYTSQQSTTGKFQRLRAYAAELGFRVTALDFWRGAEIEPLTADRVSYAMRNWPQYSWASIMVRIEKAPVQIGCQVCGKHTEQLEICSVCGKDVCEDCCPPPPALMCWDHFTVEGEHNG